jgi:hypothetical protein
MRAPRHEAPPDHRVYTAVQRMEPSDLHAMVDRPTSKTKL